MEQRPFSRVDDDDTEYRTYRMYLIIAVVILLVSGAITVLEIAYKIRLLESRQPLAILGYIAVGTAWFFGLTISGILKRLVFWERTNYNAEGYLRKEKQFLGFLFTIIFMFFITSLVIGGSRWLFDRLLPFMHLVLIEWVLIIYIWFCLEKKYRFPWFYAISTNMIVLANAYCIYYYIIA